MTSWHKTGAHPFFVTSWHKTGAHPFYIGMYIHIYTHIYVHKYTSQKECLHIFAVKCPNCMAILLTNGPWVGLEFHRCLDIQGYFATGGTFTEPLPDGFLPWHWCNPKRSSNISTDVTFLVLCYWISSGDGITWLHGWALLPWPCYGVQWAINKLC